MRAQRQHRHDPRRPEQAGPSRRALLAGLAAALAPAASACGGPEPLPAGATAGPGPDRGPLLWTGRPGGLDSPGPPGVHPSLVTFRRPTGIDVRYLPEAAGAGDDLVASALAAAVGRGRAYGRDLVVLGDSGTARAVARGWAQELGGAVLPGLGRVLPALRTSPADPGRRFSVPWRSAYVGLVQDTWDAGRPVAAVGDLWRRDLRGRVVLPGDWRDGLAVLAMAAGTRLDGAAGEVQGGLRDALGVIERATRHGRLRPAADPVEALRQGWAVAGIARSTDVQRLQAEAPGRFSFVVPDTGSLLVTDSLVVPRGTARLPDVARLVDHYLQPAVAAAVSLSVPGLCAVAGAADVMRTLDARRAASPLLFPTDADLASCSALPLLDDVDEAGYAAAYARLTTP